MITRSPQFAVGVVHSVGLDKCTMTYIHHYRITQSILTAVTRLCAPPMLLSLCPTASHNWSFPCFHTFAFSRMSYSWNCIACSLSDWLLSLSHKQLRFFHVLSCLIAHFSLPGCITGHLSTHLLKNVLVASKFWQSSISCYKYPRADFCVDISFNSTWINAKEHNCWITMQNSICDFVTNCQAIFQSSCTILHSHQQ